MLLLYLGVDDLDRSGKPYQMWAEVSREEFESAHLNDYRNPTIKAKYFDEKKMNRAGIAPSVGMVYEFREGENPGSLNLNGYQYVGRWAELDNVAEWDAMAMGRRRALDARKIEKKDSKLSAYQETLDPIREAMSKLPYPARMQLLAQVVEYLTR